MANIAEANGSDVRRLPGIKYDLRLAQATRKALTAAVSALPQKKLKFTFKVCFDNEPSGMAYGLLDALSLRRLHATLSLRE